MIAFLEPLTNKEMQDKIKPLEKTFAELPHLPKGIVEFFVSIAPWLAALGAILSAFGALNSLQLALNPASGLIGKFIDQFIEINPLIYWIDVVVLAASAVLAAFAFAPLKKRLKSGWMLMFWSTVVSILGSLADVLLGYGGILGTAIMALVGFYILFEMAPFYSTEGTDTTTSNSDEPKVPAASTSDSTEADSTKTS